MIPRNQNPLEDPEQIKKLWYVPHRRIRTDAAAKEAARIADWVRTGTGLTEDPDEHRLFVALHTCAFRAARRDFPRRIPNWERREWAKRWLDIRDHIVEQNMPLAYSLLGRFRSNGLDRDEMLSDALLGVFQAVDRFNPWKGFRFSTYAFHAIQRALIRCWKQTLTRRRRQGMLEDRQTDVQPNLDRHAELYTERLRLALDRNLGELTRMESRILEERFPEGRRSTLQEVAEVVGLSKERVRQIQNRALAKLREVLEADPVLQ